MNDVDTSGQNLKKKKKKKKQKKISDEVDANDGVISTSSPLPSSTTVGDGATSDSKKKRKNKGETIFREDEVEEEEEVYNPKKNTKRSNLDSSSSATTSSANGKESPTSTSTTITSSPIPYKQTKFILSETHIGKKVWFSKSIGKNKAEYLATLQSLPTHPVYGYLQYKVKWTDRRDIQTIDEGEWDARMFEIDGESVMGDIGRGGRSSRRNVVAVEKHVVAPIEKKKVKEKGKQKEVAELVVAAKEEGKEEGDEDLPLKKNAKEKKREKEKQKEVVKLVVAAEEGKENKSDDLLLKAQQKSQSEVETEKNDDDSTFKAFVGKAEVSASSKGALGASSSKSNEVQSPVKKPKFNSPNMQEKLQLPGNDDMLVDDDKPLPPQRKLTKTMQVIKEKDNNSKVLEVDVLDNDHREEYSEDDMDGGGFGDGDTAAPKNTYPPTNTLRSKKTPSNNASSITATEAKSSGKKRPISDNKFWAYEEKEPSEKENVGVKNKRRRSSSLSPPEVGEEKVSEKTEKEEEVDDGEEPFSSVGTVALVPITKTGTATNTVTTAIATEITNMMIPEAQAVEKENERMDVAADVDDKSEKRDTDVDSIGNESSFFTTAGDNDDDDESLVASPPIAQDTKPQTHSNVLESGAKVWVTFSSQMTSHDYLAQIVKIGEGAHDGSNIVKWFDRDDEQWVAEEKCREFTVDYRDCDDGKSSHKF